MKETTNKRTQRQTGIDHLFVPRAFRRSRLPWMLYGLLPSILLDFFLLYVVLVQYPHLIESGEMAASGYAWESAKAFLVNAIFLKAAPVYWYFELRSLRARSYIRSEGNAVTYLRITRERVNVGLPTVRYYHVFCIQTVSGLKRRRDGSVVIEGEIFVRKFNDLDEDLDLGDEKKIPFLKKTRRLVLPGYYENMDEIYSILGCNHSLS